MDKTPHEIVKSEQAKFKVANLTNVLLLGVMLLIGGQYSGWTESFAMGFWTLFIAIVFVVSGYVCLSLSLAEMTAALPFSGGTYGLARVTLGNFIAFLIGAIEAFEYSIFVAFAVGSIGSMLTDVLEWSENYEPLYWVILYLTVLIFHIIPPKMQWKFTSLLAASMFLFLLIYCVGSVPHADFDSNVTHLIVANRTRKKTRLFFDYLPQVCYMFVGIETLPLASGDTLQASKVIPKVLIYTLAIAAVTAVGVLFASASTSPGYYNLLDSSTPLSYSFSAIFNVSYKAATSFTIIAMYGKMLGFSFATTRVLVAMQKSKLLLTWKPLKYFEDKPLLYAVIAAAITNLILLYLIWRFNRSFFHIFGISCFIGAYLVYFGIFCSYIAFRSKFSTLIRHHKSPLGIYGAYWGIFVFGIAFVSAVGFQPDSEWAVLMVAILLVVLVVRYFRKSRWEQVYSSEEQAVLFIVHVMEANRVKRERIKRNKISKTPRSKSYAPEHKHHNSAVFNNIDSNNNSTHEESNNNSTSIRFVGSEKSQGLIVVSAEHINRSNNNHNNNHSNIDDNHNHNHINSNSNAPHTNATLINNDPLSSLEEGNSNKNHTNESKSSDNSANGMKFHNNIDNDDNNDSGNNESNDKLLMSELDLYPMDRNAPRARPLKPSPKSTKISDIENNNNDSNKQHHHAAENNIENNNDKTKSKSKNYFQQIQQIFLSHKPTHSSSTDNWDVLISNINKSKNKIDKNSSRSSSSNTLSFKFISDFLSSHSTSRVFPSLGAMNINTEDQSVLAESVDESSFERIGMELQPIDLIFDEYLMENYTSALEEYNEMVLERQKKLQLRDIGNRVKTANYAVSTMKSNQNSRNNSNNNSNINSNNNSNNGSVNGDEKLSNGGIDSKDNSDEIAPTNNDHRTFDNVPTSVGNNSISNISNNTNISRNSSNKKDGVSVVGDVVPADLIQ